MRRAACCSAEEEALCGEERDVISRKGGAPAQPASWQAGFQQGRERGGMAWGRRAGRPAEGRGMPRRELSSCRYAFRAESAVVTSVKVIGCFNFGLSVSVRRLPPS